MSLQAIEHGKGHSTMVCSRTSSVPPKAECAEMEYDDLAEMQCIASLLVSIRNDPPLNSHPSTLNSIFAL